jgi:hypothetical protein
MKFGISAILENTSGKYKILSILTRKTDDLNEELYVYGNILPNSFQEEKYYRQMYKDQTSHCTSFNISPKSVPFMR